MASLPAALTAEEKEHFLTNGFVHLKNCFTREQAEAVVKSVWTRLGMDPSDKSTWNASWTNMPYHKTFDAAEFAPKAWAAICELCGGEERVNPASREWRDSLIVNLGTPENEGKDIHPHELTQWHVDGDFFVHYLDSPEQGLLVVPLFTDVVPGGGGTAICPEAISKVAKHLHDNPAGVNPRMVPRGHPDFEAEKTLEWFNNVARSCSNFLEVTGECGDVFLLHPLMLHCTTSNPRRVLRIITNPPVFLNEPFEFSRPDKNYSLVEQKTLRALGRDELPGWKITGPREKRVPARLKRQAQSKEEELRRLADARRLGVTVA